MTDSYTDELFHLEARIARPVVFHVSRLVVDPERFLEDSAEPMAARGMGAIYTATSDGTVLRAPMDEQSRQALLAEYYEPHHRRLSDAVTASIARWGACLVVDCHSFPSHPLPYELDQSPDRPEICLGTDEFHSPPELVSAALRIFRGAGFEVQLNRPFAGAIVPAAHYRCDQRVMALMVEVNRSLYMDEVSGERLPTFETLASGLRQAVTELIEHARDTSAQR
jgi:N-formylglutamate amidohydrolase